MKIFQAIIRCVGVKFIKFFDNISSLWNRNIHILNLSKVLVIFVVGFVSRVLVNYFWDVNVFVDYLNSISLGYYGFMAILVVLVNELFSYIDFKLLPKINKDVFSISSIRKTFSFIINNIGNKGKVSISNGNGGLGMEKVLDKSDKVKVTGVLLMGDRDAISSGPSSSNRPTHFEGKKLTDKGDIIPSAVTGLYDGSRISSNKNISGSIKLKSRFYWIIIKQYGDKYSSYNHFSNSIDNKFSIRGELKKDFKNVFKFDKGDESSRGPSKPFSKYELSEHNLRILKNAKLTEENLKKVIDNPNTSKNNKVKLGTSILLGSDSTDSDNLPIYDIMKESNKDILEILNSNMSTDLKNRLVKDEQISRNKKISELTVKRDKNYFNSVSESNLTSKLKESRVISLYQSQVQGDVSTFSSPSAPVIEDISKSKAEPDSPSKRIQSSNNPGSSSNNPDSSFWVN